MEARRIAEVAGFFDTALTNITVTDKDVPMRASSFEEWWERACALAGPLAKVLASLPEETARAIRASAQTAAHAYETPTGVEFPGVALLASGRHA